MVKGKISEIFSSIQGEGVYQGVKQVFVRFFGCNRNCIFCDTPQHKFKEYLAPELFKKIELEDRNYHSVSFTGGEPLLQKDFLKEIASFCKWHDKTVYLETNGTLPTALGEVIELVDIIAMDFKLPTSTGAGDLWQEHEKFLRIASKKEVLVKAVICKTTQETDIIKAVEILRSAEKDIPFILQPNSFDQDDDLITKMWGYKKYCQNYLSDVRISSRYHKILAVR
ncbi:MAG: 7-carboxy-7-deazaguanine synthase QueE [Candidatus Omnitrophota bacterium]|nr:7-carboxy-7-deazaguanine synthase QueE [Candidatus Omnitrophota bacterium]